LSAQAPPFRNLTAKESAALAEGKSVFRQPLGWRDLSAPAGAPFSRDVEDMVRRLGANYLGEVILVLPRADNPDLLANLARALADVESHVGIPYWSRRHRKHFDLFDRVAVVERSGNETEGGLTADQLMEPFDLYRARHSWSLRDGRLSFRSENLTHIAYDGRNAVFPGQMVWRLEAYAEGGYWVLYGIGAVRAFDMFGLLRDRLSASFLGRIEAFFGHIYRKGLEP
ncbi:MAG TPA: DUF6675 family protein, partial [Magnetospirillaceae bacterium]|nr:DUF6675 family protein [Magnetospirillaceae bacterium]